MLIASYGDWYAKTRQDLTEQNAEVDCPECGGEGVIPELQYCNLGFCEACEGTGDVPIANLTDDEIRKVLTQAVYFNAVVQDLKRYCAYTRTSFLDAVAPFIKESRPTWRPYQWR